MSAHQPAYIPTTHRTRADRAGAEQDAAKRAHRARAYNAAAHRLHAESSGAAGWPDEVTTALPDRGERA